MKINKELQEKEDAERKEWEEDKRKSRREIKIFFWIGVVGIAFLFFLGLALK